MKLFICGIFQRIGSLVILSLATAINGGGAVMFAHMLQHPPPDTGIGFLIFNMYFLVSCSIGTLISLPGIYGSLKGKTKLLFGGFTIFSCFYLTSILLILLLSFLPMEYSFKNEYLVYSVVAFLLSESDKEFSKHPKKLEDCNEVLAVLLTFLLYAVWMAYSTSMIRRIHDSLVARRKKLAKMGLKNNWTTPF